MDPDKIVNQVATLSDEIRNTGLWIRQTMAQLEPPARGGAARFYVMKWLPFETRWKRTLKPMINIVKSGSLHTASAFLKKAASDWRRLQEEYVRTLADHGVLEPSGASGRIAHT